jgi:hypothetical protein
MDDGYPCLAHFAFEGPDAAKRKTLYTQLMLERGFLAGPSIYPTLAHDDETVARYEAAIDEVFGLIADAVRGGRLDKLLAGPVCHSGFRRLL